MRELIAVLLISSCSHLFSSEKPQEVTRDSETTDSTENVSTISSNENVPVMRPVREETDDQQASRKELSRLELKQAKLWARIDELEDQLKRTRQRMKVLERGLVLGLVPPEIQREEKSSALGRESEKNFDRKPPKSSINAQKSNSPGVESLALLDNKDAESEDEPAVKKVETPARNGSSSLAPEKEIEYQRRLAIAQDHFRAGRYGQAIAEYSALGKEFSNRIEGGAHKYWVALSWFHLKEYQTSYNGFTEFLTEFPMSSLVPRAKLELGRVEIKMGLKDKALAHFREVMRDFPYEDAAEIARMEMNAAEKNL